MASITITVQSLLNTGQFDEYTIDDGDTVADLKDAVDAATGVNSGWYNVNFNEEVLDDAETLASYDIIDGSVLGTGNVISKLTTLQDRQLAKLDLAALDRTASGNPYNVYDITQLPSQYIGNVSTPNPNPDGLLEGRPWVPVPVLTNLQLYYDPSNTSSYPGTGTTINNLETTSLPGTMSNITFTSPYFSYNGTSSQISIADNSALEPGAGDWTMEAWFRVTAFGSSQVVLGKFDNGGLAEDVSYSIRLSTTGNLFAQLGSGSGSEATLFVDSTAYQTVLSTWYQVVYVFTNVSANSLETYINGSSIGSVTHSLSSILNNTNPLYLGSYNGGEYSQWFNGSTGVVRLYNAALTADQVLQNYNADRSKYGL
jgi:hypothetical protein